MIQKEKRIRITKMHKLKYQSFIYNLYIYQQK